MKHLFLLLSFLSIACTAQKSKAVSDAPTNTSEKSQTVDNQEKEILLTLPNGTKISGLEKSEELWASELSDNAFYVLREKGTERAFTGRYWDYKEKGIYACSACGMPLFDSETKYKSGTGWPSYYQPIEDEYIREDTDYDLGYGRTEVMCNRCGGHLGHVFKDGPKPTGLRYCINSISLQFIEEAKQEEYIINYK